MAIDHSIYFQQQTPDIMGAYERGLRMRDLMKQRQDAERAEAESQVLKSTIARHMKQGPDGTVSFDRPALMADLYKIDPNKAMAYQKEFAAQDEMQKRAALTDLESNLKKANALDSLLGSAVDEQSYQANRARAIQLGLASEKTLPPYYDPNYVKGVRSRVLSIKDQIEHQFKQQELDIRKTESQANVAKTRAETAKIRAETGGTGSIKMTEAQSKALGFGRRAMLADQLLDQVMQNPNTEVSSIKTQIKAALPKWLGNLKDDREQALTTAKLAFVASVLRKESGAAVTKEEFEQYDKIYFPQPGDSPQTLANKKILRQNFIDTERLAAGPAWRDPVSASPRSQSGVRGASGDSNQSSSVRIIAPDGSIRLVPQNQVSAALKAGGRRAD